MACCSFQQKKQFKQFWINPQNIIIQMIYINNRQKIENMQETNLTVPVWIKPHLFVDLKDKSGEWRVAYILNVTKTHIKVRYDGWSSKYDETFLISYSGIRPFRSIIRGYTGNPDPPTVREQYSFTLATQTEVIDKQLVDFIQKMFTKSQFEINQFVRGRHYTWLDYLMTISYNNIQEITAVYEYFFKHFELVKLYLKQMLKCQNIEVWLNGSTNDPTPIQQGQQIKQKPQINQSSKAFAESYFEVFDSVVCILDGYPRLKGFFKNINNVALINQFISGHNNHIQFMSDYLSEVGFHQVMEQVIERLFTDKKSTIRLNFLAAFVRLWITQKTIQDKQKKRELTQKVCEICLRECIKMPDISVKQQELELQKIYMQCKLFLYKYNTAWKQQILRKFEVININSWKCMIMSQKLQRKVKAINKLKNYYINLTNIQKKQSYMLYSTKQQIDKEIKKQQILNVIFYENQHHEIIKKGCELVYELYKAEAIGSEELGLVWKSCRHRLQAVRKMMYTFFEIICKELSLEHLKDLIKLVLHEDMTEEIDKSFYYSLFRQILESSKQDKIPLLKILYQFSYTRLQQYPQQVKQFSELLTLSKSWKLGFLTQYINLIIDSLKEPASNQSTIFQINLANRIYHQSKIKELDLQNEAFTTVFRYLCAVLGSKIKKEGNLDEYNYKKQKIKALLNLLENVVSEFTLEIGQFIQIWDAFNQPYNQEFRIQEFLSWMLRIQPKGVLKVQTHILNKSFEQKQIRILVFNDILKKHTHIDYVNMNLLEFKIFKRFLIQVNILQARMIQIYHQLTGISYFRIYENADTINGLKQLWDILMNCRNQEVIRNAVRLIRQLYLNYQENQTPHNMEIRLKKIDDLLLKVHKNIQDGLKKSNIRLIKNNLLLLHSIIMEIKQSSKIPPQFVFHTHHIKPYKKNIKIIKDQKQVRDIQVLTTDSIKSIKSFVVKQFSSYIYNLKLYRPIPQNKYQSSQDGSWESGASAYSGSAYTHPINKHQHKHTKSLQEIPKQMMSAPIFSLMLTEGDSKIFVEEGINIAYQQICKFVCERMSQVLLKILADTEQYSKQSSQLAYLTLVQIPSNMQPVEILNNLIKQLRIKNKLPPDSNDIQLSSQSINFRMYFYKNVNKLKDQDFSEFLQEKNIKIYSDLFKQISKQIVDGLQIQLLVQAINFVEKGFNKHKISSQHINPQDVLQCMVNIIEFIIGLKMTSQFKRQDIQAQNLNQIKVFYKCFGCLEVMHSKNKANIIDSIVQSKYFEKLITYLYQNMAKPQYSEIFATRIQRYFKNASNENGKLLQKTEQILCHVIFDKLYQVVISNKKRKNSPFFKIVKDLIAISSYSTIQKLFNSKMVQKNLTFWQTCISIIEQESDFLTEQQKQNTFLIGHIRIVESLVKKNPEAVDQNVWKLVFFDCLCYSETCTKGNNIKCVSKNAIEAALSLLFAICQTDEIYLKYTIKQLRRYQQTSYWRTSDFWTVNLEMEMKSPTGFVGLQNPSCICYLNSFTQILYMNQQFRNDVINFKMVDPTKDYSLLIQLRKLFLNLQHSDQKFLHSIPFTRTIKDDEGKPRIKIYEQMDVQQYSSILFQKIQKLLPKNEDFVKDVFQGTYANDIISQECQHCSTREENFLSMQLDVKSSLQDSLKILVKGQMLQGQNAYFCEQCNKKVKALKRMSIKKLPNYLIICLKRFEYNFETGQKIKVNSFCEFPQQISFERYSQHYLNSTSGKEPKRDQQQQQHLDSNFDYKLKGVIIHTGSSDSGHYYALMETQPDKWVEFNDRDVSEFDVNKLADEAFGTDDPASIKSKNAYMLVYERKTKVFKQENKQGMAQKIETISQKNIQTSKQQSLLLKPQQYSQQAYSIYKQILSQNKEIGTFHLMFSRPYSNFIMQLLHYTIKSNPKLFKELEQMYNLQHGLKTETPSHQPMQKQGHKICHEQQPISSWANRHESSVIQQIIKFYLEYCLMIRSRDTNAQNFMQNLLQTQKLLHTSLGLPIIDYFIHELSQKLLVYELFIQVSLRQKMIIIVNFIDGLIKHRLSTAKQSEKWTITVLVLKLVESLLIVMVESGNVVNQIMFLIRSIMEDFKEFIVYFQRIDIFTNVFEILAGIGQKEDDKLSKIARIKEEVKYIIDKNASSQEDSSHHSQGAPQKCTKQTVEKKNMQMQDQKQQKEPEYEITPVQKTQKCVLKLQSPEEAWNYMNAIYKIETQIILKLQQQQQGQEPEPEDESLTSFYKILQYRRQSFLSQFIKLREARIQHFIEQSQGSRFAIALSLFLCQVAKDSFKITQKLIICIRRALKTLQATKFRSYLILLYYLVLNDDGYDEKKMELVLTVLTYVLQENSGYFSQTDIIHQWIMKLVIVCPQFKYAVARTPEGTQLMNKVIERCEAMKKPTQQMIKKQKNPAYQRLNYQLHGLIVSPDPEDYDKLYELKRAFFTNLFHQKPLPYEIDNPNKLLSYLEPTYQQLTHRILPGQIVIYMFHKKWSRLLVKQHKYAMVYANKIIKDTSKTVMIEENTGNVAKKQVDPSSHLIKVQNSIVDIGVDCKLGDDDFLFLNTDEKLRYLGNVEKILENIEKIKAKAFGGSSGGQGSSKGKQGKVKGIKFKQQKMDEQPASSSDLSYQSGSSSSQYHGSFSSHGN